MKLFYRLAITSLLLAGPVAGPAMAQLPAILRPSRPELTLEASETGASSARLSSAVDTTLPGRLQKALEKGLAAINVAARRGVQASVIKPGLGQWTGVAGTSYEGHPITPEMRFEIGSVTKTFTAATILQLMEEGKLSLDDSLGRFIGPYPNIAGRVTIRQLLSHTSGIFDYLNDDPEGTLLFDAYLATPNRQWTAEEIVTTMVKAPNFAPGEGIRYSNTNYVLLGMIIEQVTGKTVAEEFQRRFLTPLSLGSTYMGWEEGAIQGELAHPWSIGFDPSGNTKVQTDISSIPTMGALSSAWTAGGMVSTAPDLARWANTLYGGFLLKPSTMDQMLTFVESDQEGDVGLGVFRAPYKDKILYGHTGGILGFSSFVFSIPADSVTVAVVVNSFHTTYSVGTNSIAIALLGEVYRQMSGVANEATARPAALLEGNYPNPFASETTIRYSVDTRSRVVLEITDALGRPVARPVDDVLEPGEYSARVNLDDAVGGTYFYTLRAGDRTDVRAMQLVR